MMNWILIVFAAQCVVAGVIIVVLKSLLDRELVEAAMEKLQSSVKSGHGDVILISASVLSDKYRDRARAIIMQKIPDGTIEFKEDPALKGGVIIRLSGEEMDFSLAGRLKSIWS